MGLSSMSAALIPPLHDHAAGALVMTGLLALGVPAPGRHRMRIALTGLAFSAAVRVIHRVHRQAAHRRTHAPPANRTGLAVLAQVVLIVAELTERRAAIDVHLACLTGLEAQKRVHAFTRSVLRRAAGATRQLAAATGL